MWDSQSHIHLLERALGLLEEPVDYALGEFPLIFVIIHLQDLFEGRSVDAISTIGKAQGAIFGLQRRRRVSFVAQKVDSEELKGSGVPP